MKRKELNSRAAKLVVPLMVCTAPQASVVTSFSDIDILGTYYNVSFQANESFNTLFDSNGNGIVGEGEDMYPTFWGNKVGAQAARDIIIEALGKWNTLEAAGRFDGFMIPFKYSAVDMVYTMADNNGLTYVDSPVSFVNIYTTDTLGLGGISPAHPIATFEHSVATVPIPPSVFMYAPALIGLFGYSRHKKVQNLVTYSNTNAPSV